MLAGLTAITRRRNIGAKAILVDQHDGTPQLLFGDLEHVRVFSIFGFNLRHDMSPASCSADGDSAAKVD